MNRRLVGTLGLAAAAVIGTTVPAWAYWTLTSHPSSVAAAKATQLNAANVEAGRNGVQGGGAQITIRIAPGPGAFPDRFTVFRGPDLICLDTPTDETCVATGSANSGDKIYTITAYAGTNWVSAVSTCSFKSINANPDVPTSTRCAPLSSPLTGVSSSSSSSGFAAASDDSTSKGAPTPTTEPGADEPISTVEPDPVSTEPVTEPTPEPTPEPLTEPTPQPTVEPDPVVMEPTPEPEPAPEPNVEQPAEEATESAPEESADAPVVTEDSSTKPDAEQDAG